MKRLLGIGYKDESADILFTMQETIELSIVLPCLNEAETLEVCINKAKRSIEELGIDGEVLVADNGSSDNSTEIAMSNGARVVDVPTKGYGSALLAGFKDARGKFIIMADADDSYSLDEISEFISELRKGADLVMGNRFAGTIHSGAMPWLHKYIGNPILSFVGRLFFKSKIRDFHCGLRGLNRERILELDLNTPGMEFASEIVVKALLSNYKIVEVPTDLKPDGRSRAPHLRTWRDGWRHLRFLLFYSPRWLFFYPGLLTATVGLIGIIFLSKHEQVVLSVKLDLQTLVFASFALILGLQSVWFAILSKASSISKGFMPIDRKWEKLLKVLGNESLYLIYVGLILAGLLNLAEQVFQWADNSFGEMKAGEEIRQAMIAATIMTIGVQSLMSHMLLSIITMGPNKSKSKI